MIPDRDLERTDSAKVTMVKFYCDKCDEYWEAEMVDELGYYGPAVDGGACCPICGLIGEEDPD